MPDSLSRAWSWLRKNAAVLTVLGSVLSGSWYLAKTLPTKGDLERLATQESLRGLASQADLRGLVSQDDLASLSTQVATAVETLNTAVGTLDTAVQTLNTGISVLGSSVTALQESMGRLDAAAVSAAGEMSETTRALNNLTDEKLPALVRCMVALNSPEEQRRGQWGLSSVVVPPGADPQPTVAQSVIPEQCRQLVEQP